MINLEKSSITVEIPDRIDPDDSADGVPLRDRLQNQVTVMTRENDDFLEFVIDQLQRLPDVRSRRMFGAHGLYQAGVFFAIVDRGSLYFRTGDANRGEYVERGMMPFEYKPGGVLKNYYQVPVDVLEDDGLLCRWAEDAVRAQVEHQTKSSKKTRRKKR